MLNNEISASEKLTEECLLNMLRIAADANKELAKGITISNYFACFVGAFTPIKILQNLEINNVEVITQNEKEDKQEEDLEEDFEQPEDFKNDKMGVSSKTLQFLEIMNKDPEFVTYEEKRDVFKLFPEAFQFIRSDVM